MPSTQAVSTIGAKVYRRASGASTDQEVKECIQLPELGAPRSEIPTTYSSASATTRIPGRKDGKEVEFRFNRIPNDPVQEAIIDNFTSDDVVNETWKVTADGDNSRIWGFELAYLDVFVDLPIEGQQQFVVRGRISGDVDWDATIA